MRLIFALCLAACAHAQKSPFRSITIEENTSGVLGGSVGGRPPVLARNGTLRVLVMYAYGIDEAAKLAGPDWINSTHYDITATLKDPKARYDLREVLRRLLEDRFKLTTHLDTTPRAVYFLTVADGGPRMQEFKPNHGSQPIVVPRGGAAGPMKGIAARLSTLLGDPVIDGTGLTGSYLMGLNIPAEYRDNVYRRKDEPLRDDARAAIISAVESQLGLKLTAAKAPGEARVIDHIEKPAN